jgi:hypothetical protein
VRVEDPSLERCRHRALDELDAQLAAWLTDRATRNKGTGNKSK